MKNKIGTLAFILLFSIGVGAQSKSFNLYNQVRYSGSPTSLLPYLLPIKIANESQLLNASDSTPNEAAIENFAAQVPPGELVTLDLETWPYYPAAQLTSTINRFLTSISYFKSVNTTSPIGFYGVPPRQAYQWSSIDPVNNPGGYYNWKLISDSLARVAKNVDNFQPSFYSYDADTTSWRKMVDTTIAAIKRYSTTKPIYAYIWPQYHQGTGALQLQFIDTAIWKYELRTLYDRADGVIIWTSNKDPNNNTIYWDPNMLWWQATKAFMVEKSLASPFEIDKFNLNRTANSETLDWSTSIDTTTQNFFMERSIDGVNYQAISGPISPAANHYTENIYQYVDNSSADSIYYRLKMVNKDGSTQYSSVISTGALSIGSTAQWVEQGGIWTYGLTPHTGNPDTLINTSTTAYVSSLSTDPAPFLPAPPSGITRAFIAAKSGASFSLDTINNKLTMVSGASGISKFSAYNIANPTQVANASFNMTFDSIGPVANNTNVIWSIGNTGASGSSLYSNANSIYTANNSGNSLFTALKWTYNASMGTYVLSYRQGAVTTVQTYRTLTGPDFYPGVQYTANVFCNNSSLPQSYIFNGSSYSVAAQSFQLWITNTSTQAASRYYVTLPTYDLPNSVETNSTTGDKSIPANAVLNSFLFQGSSNTGNMANIIIDGGMSVSFGNLSALPVSFLSNSFIAQLMGKSVLLDWSTASEQNNAYFEIYRSADAKYFNLIGKVTGNQTTSLQHNYSFTDDNPNSGINYYKLQQVDIDGKTTYSSNIVLVSVPTRQNAFSVYIAGGQLNANAYSAAAENAELKLFSISGQQLSNTKVQLSQGDNHFNVDVSSFQTGVYIAVLKRKNQLETVKFLK